MEEKFLYNSKEFIDRRRDLRNNQTKEEKLLWKRLQGSKLGFKFVRQYGVGPYILDFYCPKLRLAIELDGGHHREPETKLYDTDRSKYLKALDITVLRFWNAEVTSDIDGVIKSVSAHIPLLM